MTIQDQVDGWVRAASGARRALQRADTGKKSQTLRTMARLLRERAGEVLAANAKDLEQAEAAGRNAAHLDRLRLTSSRVEGMAQSLEEVAALPDPVGEGTGSITRPNGLQIGQVRVPIGVVAVIYEARPNVTSEAASLCLKSSNVCLLKGGSDSIASNRAIVTLLKSALELEGLPSGAITFVDTADRDAVDHLLKRDDLVDLVIPRGGEGLIRAVVEKSRIPVIKQYKGVCHTFVDEGADHGMAERIAINAKVSRPSVCNAMETLLVHAAEAETFLPRVAASFKQQNVELRGCAKSREIVPWMTVATAEDWATEYLDLILSVKVVSGLDEAMDHIASYSTGHSEAIVTRDVARARRFLDEVDAAAVYVNASTRFTDGGCFGMGAEIGISTGKLHSRGPMGLRELTTLKYVIWGDGQIRE